MSTPLFRDEVLQARQVQWLGGIRLARPPSFAWVTGLALACAVALVSFAIYGEYTRKVSLPGVLVPEGGVMDISSPQPGTVAEVLVKEGDHVEAGQPLIRLRAERQTAGGELGALQAAAIAQRRLGVETELRLAEQQAQQRAAALGERLRSLQADQGNLQAELEGVQQRVQLATRTAKNFEDLAAKGFVPQLQAQQRQEDLLDLAQRERSARRQLAASEREQGVTRAELIQTRTQLEGSRAQLQRQLAGLLQEGNELGARAGWTLTAPQAGKVATLNAVQGQGAQAGLNLVALLPAQAQSSMLVAHLYAPSRAAGFIQPGQSVRLAYDAYPYQKFGLHAGRVKTVSSAPVNPQDLPVGRAQALMQAAQAQEPMYRVTVQLERQHLEANERAQSLRSGMGLQAQVRRESRAIWEWALEPLIAIRRVVGPQTADTFDSPKGSP